MSIFSDGMDVANTAFGSIAGETFSLVKGGVPGTYAAINVDDLTAGNSIVPGGLRSDATVTLYLSTAVMIASGLIQGSVVVVRGERLRVDSTNDDGDNTHVIPCVSAGVKF